MSVLQIILGILAFAVVTAVLYVWGMRKSVTQTQDLTKQLQNKGANMVMKMLKKQSVVTNKQVADAVKGIKAHQAWSKKYAGVNDAQSFAKSLLDWMESQQLVEKCTGGYCIKKEK